MLDAQEAGLQQVEGGAEAQRARVGWLGPGEAQAVGREAPEMVVEVAGARLGEQGVGVGLLFVVDAHRVPVAFAEGVHPLVGAEGPVVPGLAGLEAGEADGQVAPRARVRLVAPGVGDAVGGYEVVGGEAGGGDPQGWAGVVDGRVGDGHQI